MAQFICFVEGEGRSEACDGGRFFEERIEVSSADLSWIGVLGIFQWRGFILLFARKGTWYSVK